jgi:hypothetical protein
MVKKLKGTHTETDTGTAWWSYNPAFFPSEMTDWNFIFWCMENGFSYVQSFSDLLQLVLVSWGGVWLSPLGMLATKWPIVPAPDDSGYRAFGVMRMGRENRSTRRKYAPVSLCSPQSHKTDLQLNPGCHSGKLACNHLSYGKASDLLTFSAKNCKSIWIIPELFPLTQFFTQYPYYVDRIEEYNKIKLNMTTHLVANHLNYIHIIYRRPKSTGKFKIHNLLMQT